jgi:WD40 repeat protein
VRKDDTIVASGGDSGEIDIWDVRSTKLVKKIEDFHTEAVRQV